MFDLVSLKVTPGKLDAVEAEFSSQMIDTNSTQNLNGTWRTEIGELNQIIHLWKLDNCDADKRRHQKNNFNYSGLSDFVIDVKHRTVIIPKFFTEFCNSSRISSLIEIRIYHYEKAAINEVIDKWDVKLNERVKLSTMLICGYTDTHPISELIHVWAYRDLNERQLIRQKAIEKNCWPPGAFKGLIGQENSIVIPAKFTPLG